MKQLILLTLLLLSFYYSPAQAIANYGIEIGISSSDFPQKRTVDVSDVDKITEEYRALISPLLGINSQLIIHEHMRFTAGLQYQMTGNRYHQVREGRVPHDPNLPAISTYIEEIWEQQKFHKLSLPLTLGYTMKIGNVRPTIFVGFKFNFFLGAKYKYEYDFDSSDDEQDQAGNLEYRPIILLGHGYSVISPLQAQHILGFSIELAKRINLRASYNQGYVLRYSRSRWTPGIPEYAYFKNLDLELSVTYWLDD